MKQLVQQIKQLLIKDLVLEWRQKYALSGIFLYLASTIVLIYISFTEKIEPITWVTLFWIILLFAAVNAIAKSFLQESKQRQLYYYSLVSPQAVILAKLIYNTILLSFLSLIGLGMYVFFMGNPIEDFSLFMINIGLGTVGFSFCFTLIAAIAAQASNNATLMPILSFPIIIPMLGLLIKISKAALLGLEDDNTTKDINILLAIDGVMVVLSFILFPYLWQD